MPLLFLFLLATTLGSFTLLVKTIDPKIPPLKLPSITLPKDIPIPTPTPEVILEDQDLEISDYDLDPPLIETITPTATPTATPKPVKKVTKAKPSSTPTPQPKYTPPTFKPIPTVNLDQIRRQQQEWWQNVLKRQEEFKRQSKEGLEKFRKESERKMLEFQQQHGF